MDQLLTQLQAAQEELEPQFKALRGTMNALRTAIKLASEEKADALPMQKALLKLEAAAAEVENDTLKTAVSTFTTTTQTALDNLAFEFARDLRDEFIKRGETVNGRPPTLVVNGLTLQLDSNARKGQWFYGKEALTRPLALSFYAILRAYDQQVKRITNRTIDSEAFLAELHTAWQDCINKRSRRPGGGRINIIEVHAQITLNRQNNRFWNAPSRSTFKDYDRPLFVRDLVLLRQDGPTRLTVEGQPYQLQLGVATKSQAEQSSRSLWLPSGPQDGEYYSDITFD
jgi:hypothetical protein